MRAGGRLSGPFASVFSCPIRRYCRPCVPLACKILGNVLVRLSFSHAHHARRFEIGMAVRSADELDVETCVVLDRHISPTLRNGSSWEARRIAVAFFSDNEVCGVVWRQPHPTAVSDVPRKAEEAILISGLRSMAELSARVAIDRDARNRHLPRRCHLEHDARKARVHQHVPGAVIERPRLGLWRRRRRRWRSWRRRDC